MISYVLNAVLITLLIILVIARIAAGRLVGHHHAQRVDFFRHYPIQPGDVVFLGDSLTAGASWDELFPGLPVKNRGINADTVSGVLARLDGITSAKPAAVFLLIGTNDLPFEIFHSDQHILDHYAAVLERLRAETPETQVFVESLLPRTSRFTTRIRRINAGLEKLAARYGCTFIDLFPHFATPDGRIRPEFNNDHLHLLGSGYQLWVSILSPYIEKLNLQPIPPAPSHMG